MSQSLDKYAFIRDAYLQHRHFLITGEQPLQESGDLYIDDEEDAARSSPNSANN